MSLNNEQVVIESHPWPYKGIYEYPNIRHAAWGTLEFYEANPGGLSHFSFRADKQPSDSEIIKRWGRIMLKAAPHGESTIRHFELKVRLEILNGESGYCIGCLLDEGRICVESVERWKTREEAIECYLSCNWKKESTLVLDNHMGAT